VDIWKCAGRRRAAIVESSSRLGVVENEDFPNLGCLEHSNMKFLAQCVVVASLLCAVSAVTYTMYTDAACATPVTATSSNPNPEVVSINKCVTVIGSGFYQKIHACATGGKAAGALYTDSGCSAKQAESDFEVDEGKCTPRGSGSQKLTCDPASSLSVAFLAVFASVLAMFVF
jgi:hypothetical protein